MANELIKRNGQFNEELKHLLDYAVKESMPDTFEDAVLRNSTVDDGLLIAYDLFKAYERLADEYANTVNEMSAKLDSIQEQLSKINAKLLLDK